MLSLHDSLPYRLSCHDTTLNSTDCDVIQRLFALQNVLSWYDSLLYRLCCHYITLYPTECAVIRRLFTLQTVLSWYDSLFYRLWCHSTTLCPTHCAVITRLFTLQNVLSLHDSLPYRLSCHDTTLYPTDCAVITRPFTLHAVLLLHSSSPTNVVLWFVTLHSAIQNCYPRTAPQSGRHNLNDHRHENQAFPFTNPRHFFRPAASVRPQADKNWQAYAVNSLFHFPRLSMRITNEVHIDISISIPWQNSHETTNEDHKSWRPISRFRRSYDPVFWRPGFFPIIIDDVDKDHKRKGHWNDTFLTVSRAAADESSVPISIPSARLSVKTSVHIVSQ